MQDYRKLRVWKGSHELVLAVRRATHSFPKSGYSSLKSQMTRSAESIPFNIVEGCGARSPREFARFLAISIKSAFELQYQLRLSRDYEILEDAPWITLRKQTVDVRRMLCGLRKKVLGEDS